MPVAVLRAVVCSEVGSPWDLRIADQLARACVALAKEWRTEKYLRKLEVRTAW